MTWPRIGATALLATAFILASPAARADSYCFQEECVYVGEIGIVVGGVASIAGCTASLFDDEPDSLWYGLGYGFGAVNLVVGGIIAAVGAGLEEEDDDRETLITVGATQAGMGAFGVFMAAVAQGHYDSTERGSRWGSTRTDTTTGIAPIVVPLVDSQSGMPSGAMLSATF